MSNSKSSKRSKRDQIPGYRLLKKLGSGGMGSVFRAEQISLNREIAIKIMPQRLSDDPEFRERFYREARAAGRLNHPNIVQGYDAGISDNYCWIAMELVDGKPVSRLRREKERLSEREALSIIKQIALALEHAEKASIVHRDVKPENFLISKNGTVKLCDLGISKNLADDTLTNDGRAMGTPLYISPEQARGEPDIDSRADIYSLGASWYHLLAGVPPFTGSTAAVILAKHVSDPLPQLNKMVKVSRETCRVIERMMEKDKNKRYRNFSELLTDLSALGEGKKTRAAKEAKWRPITSTRKSTLVTIAITAVLTLAMLFYMDAKRGSVKRHGDQINTASLSNNDSDSASARNKIPVPFPDMDSPKNSPENHPVITSGDTKPTVEEKISTPRPTNEKPAKISDSLFGDNWDEDILKITQPKEIPQSEKANNEQQEAKRLEKIRKDLEDSLVSDAPARRLRALKQLCTSFPDSAQQYAKSCIKDRNREIRLEVVRILSLNLNSPENKKILQDMSRTDISRQVREAASQAIN